MPAEPTKAQGHWQILSVEVTLLSLMNSLHKYTTDWQYVTNIVRNQWPDGITYGIRSFNPETQYNKQGMCTQYLIPSICQETVYDGYMIGNYATKWLCLPGASLAGTRLYMSFS